MLVHISITLSRTSQLENFTVLVSNSSANHNRTGMQIYYETNKVLGVQKIDGQ